MRGTHIFHRDLVANDATARRTRDNNATISSVDNTIVVDSAVGAADSNAIGQLLGRIGAARTDVVLSD